MPRYLSANLILNFGGHVLKSLYIIQPRSLFLFYIYCIYMLYLWLLASIYLSCLLVPLYRKQNEVARVSQSHFDLFKFDRHFVRMKILIHTARFEHPNRKRILYYQINVSQTTPCIHRTIHIYT